MTQIEVYTVFWGGGEWYLYAIVDASAFTEPILYLIINVYAVTCISFTEQHVVFLF
jgi:hypothetical protein